MGGFFSSHSVVEKTFKKNQEYISEMNKNKVLFSRFIDWRPSHADVKIDFCNLVDRTLDSDAISNQAKRKGSGNSKKS